MQARISLHGAQNCQMFQLVIINNFAQISQGAREGRPRQAVLDLPPEEPQGVQGSAC